MPEILVQVIEQAPTFVGLVLLAYILYRQNEKLMEQLFNRTDKLERKMDDLRNQVAEIVTKLL